MSKMKSICFFVVISMLALQASSCSDKKMEESVIPTVKTDTVQVYGQEISVSFPGKVRASEDVNLAFRIGGTLWKFPVETGTFVKKGQLLAELDPRDYKVQLSATEAEYQQVKSEAERIFALYEKKSVSLNDYEKARYGLQQITAKYNAHKNALKDTRLLAPFDGYVQKKFFGASEVVGAGNAVVSMINNNLPEVEISLPASYYMQRDQFESFTCVSDLFLDEVFPLEIVGIAQKANLNQLYTMRLKMKPSRKNLPVPGMAVSVTIYYKKQESVLTSVPFTALFGENDNSKVWVYNAQTKAVVAKSVKIKEVLTNGKAVIAEGLQPGEIVVSAGTHSLKEGARVNILPTVSSTNIGDLL